MFDDCNSLAELNATRIKLLSEEGSNLIQINNAYNQRRNEILSNRRAPYTILEPIFVKALEVKKYCGIPVCGRNAEAGVITLTDKGFLY